MSVCVFVGPTLSVSKAKTVLDAIYLPPVRQGDAYRAVSLLRPQAIGVIDGYFQWSPAVWHKELLWAIEQGVHVFGSASMGALRAAELAPFGMRGVGCIFEAYRDGVLERSGDEPFEDDDEVAVVHGPPESGYVAASDAMVDIRCTFADAVRGGVIREATRVRLLAIAKAMFFPERNYAVLLEQGRAAGLAEAELAALERWLPSGRVNQKRADAVAMLEAMRDFVDENPCPAKAGFTFERTTLWESAVAVLESPAAGDPVDAAVLDELRLEPAKYEAHWREALDALTGTSPNQTGVDAIPASPGAGTSSEGERHLEKVARLEAARRLRAQVPIPLTERQMLAKVREAGAFQSLRTRVEQKRACLAAQPQLPDIEAFSELQLLQLRDWYFAKVVGSDMPDDLDRHVRECGYTDLARFHRAIFAEYVYRRELVDEGSISGGAPEASASGGREA